MAGDAPAGRFDPLRNLLRLQELDLQIEDCLAREKEIPKQKEKFAVRRERLQKELEAREEQLKALQLEQRQLEGDIEQMREQIVKYDTQQFAVKKNEEYNALEHEKETLRRQIGQKEERIIQIMMELEEAQERLEADRARIEQEFEAIDREYARIDQELADAKQARETLERQRQPVLAEVDRSLLAKYDRIRKSKGGGAAIVPLNDEVCGGCHMAVPPQLANEVLAGEVHPCKTCGRLLYHKPNFEVQPA